jgi:hypothetical protein
MSCFTLDPKCLIYLSPMMSPSETSKDPSLLEHPQKALGIEALEGFVGKEPLRRIHECVFGVLVKSADQ